MFKFSRSLILIASLITLASCAVAPINNTTTARSIGKDANQLKINVAVPGAMYERGLTEDWDLGVGLEIQTEMVLNIYSKYALVNNQEGGFSVAGIGGFGLASDTKSVYAGPVFSWRHDWFEIFSVARLNYVSWQNHLSDDDKVDLFSFIPDKATFFYTQLDVGVSYVTPKALASIGMKFFSLEKENASGAPFVDFAFKF